jgi:GntR family transcriptional regulator/MocR family aminotransferase
VLTITFEDQGRQPLYQQLYSRIKEEIEAGRLAAGARLPSKRKMADHLKISLTTVENAYAQLSLEGYVASREKRAYYVRPVEKMTISPVAPEPPRARVPRVPARRYLFDLSTSRVSLKGFPFSIWTKLMRESLRDESASLLEPVPPQGDLALRREIVNYLRQFRSMRVTAEQVVVGAGTEYLLGLLTELLPGAVFALENPNYHKPARIFQSRRVKFAAISMDQEGLSLAGLTKTQASVALVTPSHHFPLGTVMSVGRRRQLLQWAAARPGRYLIEDDYDSEYRFALKPVPPLHSLGSGQQVIYLNTFTRTLAPSLRIAYMVLPPGLSELYERKLAFYACPVSEFEQCALRKFIEGGYYERHLNRLRNLYRARRDVLMQRLAPLAGAFSLAGQAAGLHLLLTSRQGWPEEKMIRLAAQNEVRVYGLSSYYLGRAAASTVIIGYAGLEEAELGQAAARLVAAWGGG